MKKKGVQGGGLVYFFGLDGRWVAAAVVISLLNDFTLNLNNFHIIQYKELIFCFKTDLGQYNLPTKFQVILRKSDFSSSSPSSSFWVVLVVWVVPEGVERWNLGDLFFFAQIEVLWKKLELFSLNKNFALIL